MKRRSILLGATIGAVAPVVAGVTPALAADLVPRRSIESTSPTPAPRRPASPTHSSPPRWPGPTLASRLKTLPPQTTQVIIVYSDGYNTTYATLETFSKVDDHWRTVSAPLPARIGSKGFSDNHEEGVPTTPTGVYAIGDTMYGIGSDPGVRYPYHKLVSGDWWNENSDSPYYNTFQHSSTALPSPSEALWLETPDYTHFAVITYNMPPNVPEPIPYAGSGIFLHEFGTVGGNATAGCVSLAHDHLVGVLRWLDPAASPRIVLSPAESLSRY